MSGLTSNYNLYLPTEGDGEINGQTWAEEVNQNFTIIDSVMKGHADALAGTVSTTDYRLSNARPAADVYAWAKASTKPVYTPSEVGAEPAIIPGTAAQVWLGSKAWATLDTALVPENGNLYYTNARAIAAPLTGYAVGANAALDATDSILGAFGKVQAQLNAKLTSITSSMVTTALGYTPLNKAGDTLTGALNGTTATFTGMATLGGVTAQRADANEMVIQIKQNPAAGGNAAHLYSQGDGYLGWVGIDSTGARRFAFESNPASNSGRHFGINIYDATGANGVTAQSWTRTGSTFNVPITAMGGSFSGKLSIITTLAGDTPLLMQNLSPTGYGARFDGGTSGKYSLSVRDYTGAVKFQVDGSGDATLSGSLSASGTSHIFGNTGNTSTYVYLRAAAGANREYRVQTDGAIRWSFGADGTAESGSDAGSLFVLRAYTDAGAQIDLPFTIIRAAGGAITMPRPISVNYANAIVTIGNGGSGTDASLVLNGGVGNRYLKFQTSGVGRWLLGITNSAETGVDAGSGLRFAALTDAGATIDYPFEITRAAGGWITLRRPTNLQGQVSVGTTSGSSVLDLNGAASLGKYLRFQTAGLNRWALQSIDAESTGNAGSNLYLGAYNDAGALIDYAVVLTRAAGGTLAIYRPTTITGQMTLGSDAGGANFLHRAVNGWQDILQVYRGGGLKWRIQDDGSGTGMVVTTAGTFSGSLTHNGSVNFSATAAPTLSASTRWLYRSANSLMWQYSDTAAGELLHTGNVGTNAATLQAAVASATAPLVGTVAQRTAYTPASGTFPYWYATDETAPDGLPGTLRQWTGSAWGAAANPSVVAGRVTAGVISAGAIGAQALAADVALVGQVLRSTGFTPNTTSAQGTGFKLSGTAFSSQFLDTAHGGTGAAPANVYLEIGSDVNFGGYPVGDVARLMTRANRILNGSFWRTSAPWSGPNYYSYQLAGSSGATTYYPSSTTYDTYTFAQSFNCPAYLRGSVYLKFTPSATAQGQSVSVLGSISFRVNVYLKNSITGVETLVYQVSASASYNEGTITNWSPGQQSIDVSSYMSAGTPGAYGVAVVVDNIRLQNNTMLTGVSTRFTGTVTVTDFDLTM